ncbi:MAG TPA: DUF5615 family PIN-like protein [Pirellulales bacterium]
MPGFLANENVTQEVVDAARQAGHDLKWIKEMQPGVDDDTVLQLSLAENRVLLTFDKDFGEMAFRHGKSASCGIILFRPRIRTPEYLPRFAMAVLAQPLNWEGHFTVAREGRLRIIALP